MLVLQTCIRGRAVVVITHDELLARLAGNRIVDLSSQKRG